MSPSQICDNFGCYCDQSCYNWNDCCSDIANISCYPDSSPTSVVSVTPTNTIGKTKSF